MTGPSHGGWGKIERRERDDSKQHGTWSICAIIINVCWVVRFEQRAETSYAKIFLFFLLLLVFFFFGFCSGGSALVFFLLIAARRPRKK